jgi:hypothetical protein
MRTSKKLVSISSALIALAALPACGDDDESGAGPRKNYAIELEPGHTHVFKTYDVTFAVRDLDRCTDAADTSTCAGVPNLPLSVFKEPFNQPRVEQELAANVLVDNEDGTYTWTTAFEWLVPYLVGAEFEHDGNTYSRSFPYETSKAGGEAIFCPALPDPVPEGWVPTYNYQVRWHANPGRVVANGTTKVAFDLDLRRTIEITNVEQPWRNSFDSLLPENLEIPTGGSAADKLTVHFLDKANPSAPLSTHKLGAGESDVKYVGLGIYRVTRAFAASELGGAEQKNFMLRVVFDDDATADAEECPVVDETDEADTDDYTFPVYAAP